MDWIRMNIFGSGARANSRKRKKRDTTTNPGDCRTTTAGQKQWSHNYLVFIYSFYLRVDFKVHQGEVPPPGETLAAWLIEPHIRHNNTIQTWGNNLRKTISIPFECEWPTSSVGADPLGFRIGGGGVEFATQSNIVLRTGMNLYTDESFLTPFEEQPTFGGCLPSGTK